MRKQCLYGCSILLLSYIIRVMIHQPIAAFYEAQIGEFVLEAEELLKLREILTRVYAQRTGKPLCYGLYPKTWKGMFLCQQQKPKFMELLIL